MRVATIALSFALIFPNPLLSVPHLHRTPQQAAATSPTATLTLQNSLATLVGNVTVTDVTLTGSVHYIAGSDDETGSATLKALSSGDARSDLSLSSGTHSEIYSFSASGPAGAWSGPDGVSHPIVYHNLLAEPAWFSPTFAIARRLSSGYTITDLGPTTHNGQQVEHMSVSQNSPTTSLAAGPLFQHLTQVDFFLDSVTSLPAAVTFAIHPDNDALLDIPVEIDFSDYRSVSGAKVPFHVQKSLNDSLLLDIQIQNVSVNSGLSASAFAIQ
jgi:hypothetical protein